MNLLPFSRDRRSRFYYSNYSIYPSVQDELINNENVKINIEDALNLTCENLEQYLHRLIDYEIRQLQTEALKSDNLCAIKLIAEYKSHHMIIAAQYGSLEVIKHLAKYIPLNEEVIATAARYGQLETVKYLFESGTPINETAISDALNNNQTMVLYYLFNNRAPIDRKLIYPAITYNHIRIVKHLFMK